MKRINPLRKTDSYKPAHPMLYKPGTDYMQNYFESRTNSPIPIKWFGPQAIIKEHLLERFTKNDVDEMTDFSAAHYGRTDVFPAKQFSALVSQNEGRWPINIYTQEEGKRYLPGTPLMLVEPVTPNPDHFWTVGYIEGLLSHAWYPTSVATNSAFMKDILKHYLELSSDLKKGTPEFDAVLNFMLHDFGFRGVSGVEQAGLGGMSHLLNFLGTDTMIGIDYAQYYYNTNTMLGFSIPASEHSTWTSWGGPEGEADAMRHMLNQFPTGLIAGVSDSYDVQNAIRNIWGDQLKDLVLGRDGRLVIRLDSGDQKVSTQKNFEAAWEVFGGTVNSKGFKVLNPKVRLIQGDGIDVNTLRAIVANLIDHKIALENFAFGSGGGLLQKLDRDTHKFAIKCNMVRTDGIDVDVFKSPMEYDKDGNYVTSFKKSKSGNLKNTSGLRLVYSNGELFNQQIFDDMRELTT